MKSNLSALKFVRNNKRQVGVMLIALSLTCMAMYVVNFLLMTTEISYKAVMIEKSRNFFLCSLSNSTMGLRATDYASDEEFAEAAAERRDEIIMKLKEREDVQEAYFTQGLSGKYQGIVGVVEYMFPLLSVEEVPGYISAMDAKLIEGRLPEADGEIVVEETMFHNQNMILGDYFLDERYGKLFQVVGVVKSDRMHAVGTPQGYANNGWYFFVVGKENIEDGKKLLKEIGIETTEYDSVYDMVALEEEYLKDVQPQFETAILLISLVVMFFLAISILISYVSFMRSRMNEYCLYISLGFSRGEVYGMMMREIGLIFGISLLVGAAVTVGILLVLGNTFMRDMGLVFKYWDSKQFLRIITSFLVIVGILQIPIGVTIQNIKTIDNIEEQ